MQGRAGVSDDAVGVEPVVGRDRDPHAYGRKDLASVHDDGPREFLDDRVREGGGRRAGVVGRHQDHELVAAEPREERVLTDALADSFRNGLQKQVADVVAVGVIDLFEAVEVHEEDGEVLAEALRPIEREGQAFLENRAIREPRQNVEPDLAREQFLDAKPVRHVVRETDDSDDRAIGIVEARLQARAVQPTAERKVTLGRFAEHGATAGLHERVARVPITREVDCGAAEQVEIVVSAREEFRAEDGAIEQIRIREPDECRHPGNETIEPGIQRAELWPNKFLSGPTWPPGNSRYSSLVFSPNIVFGHRWAAREVAGKCEAAHT